MKKFMTIAAMAAAVLVSCNKDNGKDNGPEEQGFKKEWRVASMDGKPFTYDAQGRVTSYGDEEESRELVWNGTKLTINNIYKGEKTVEYECEVNADGLITKATYGDGNTLEFTYKDGYMVECKVNGAVESGTKQLVEDGNIIYWTRYDEKNSFFRMKKATYLDKQNLGGTQTHWAEDAKMKRWTWEAGLLGKTSVNVLESCRWYNFGDVPAEKTAVYTYEYDDNGCIAKETKYYGVWNETDTTGMDFDDEHTFTYEKIK